MRVLRPELRVMMAVVGIFLLSTTAAAQPEFVPEVGQAGKDVIWVPTPPELVERMLDLANVTANDFVMDLGSGDGRNIIAAAKRGARALGVEYNQDMVELSNRLATQAGVADRAKFVQGDMYEADISKANVLALFLLPSNLLRLRDKFLELQPGSRIVSNTFEIQSWTADERVQMTECENWCTALLYVVPAKVAGTWRVPGGTLTLTQEFQMVKGTLTGASGEQQAVSGRLRGAELTLQTPAGDLHGRVNGSTIDAKAADGTPWQATRISEGAS